MATIKKSPTHPLPTKVGSSPTSITDRLPCQHFMTRHIDLRTSKVFEVSMTLVMPESPKFLLPCGRHLHANQKLKKILSVPTSTQENFHSC